MEILRHTFIGASLIAGCLLAGNVVAQVEGPVTMANAATYPGLSGAGNSTTPVLSADGRVVVFVSQARNLVTNDDHSPYLNVYARDLVTSSTKLVSVRQPRNSPGAPLTRIGGGNGNSGFPRVSSNAQFIAFESTASNLTTNDMNGVSDIFVRDMVAGTTRLVSVNWQGTAAANKGSSGAVISPDGRWVAFESEATDVVPGDENGISDIFVRDLVAGTNYLVSVGAYYQNTPPRTEAPAMTPDGHRIAFASAAGGLVSGVANLQGDIYVRDLLSSTTLWASSNVVSFLGGSYRCLNPVISDDGRIVIFKAAAYQGDSSEPIYVFRHDLDTGATTILSTNSIESTWPAISADGRFAAYEARGTCGFEIRRWDEQTQSNALVNVDLSGIVAGSGDAFTPVMSADGSKIAFLFAFIPRDSAGCLGGPLTTNVINNEYQLFLRDMDGQVTRLISATPGGPA